MNHKAHIRTTSGAQARRSPQDRRGTALLVAIFVMAVCTALVLAVADTQTLQLSALRNAADYERALYLAGAAVHHALAELEQDTSWRTGIGSTTFPVGSSYTYSATAVDGSGGTVVITGTGVAGSITRKLQVTVSFG